eukprot:TRINITY_DN2912_c0_g5_i1.p1 TRINITY_DN2912_c0_g5~~TRINITY_DN2912_c0_g5_i1.p1  ORF type:complete len:806 (-),score=295.59 TRINITY_DN2912_c0_g5_i1:353-2770(-)
MLPESPLNGLGLPVLNPDVGEEKAIPLIRLQKDTFVLEPEAVELLKQISAPVSFLCVCGKYRTGKSYLLNKVLLGSRGFSIGSTINACTKGLWIWKRPFKFLTEEKEEVAVFVVDTEGLGAIDEDATHDTKVVLLGLLLSSLMIYNSVGSIDENALNSLSLVVNIAKSLQTKNSGTGNEEEFAKNFPAFFWVLRDFSLQLKDPQGNMISPRQYLENALSLQKGNSDAVENKNKVRRLLKHFFADRDCATLVRPTENESDLQNLIELADEKLRTEFMEQLGLLRARIRKKLKVKIVNGKKVNGPMLVDLCESYTEAINSGQVPCIDNAWSYMCKSQCESALSDTQLHFEEAVKKKVLNKLPLTEVQIKQAFNEIKEESIRMFRERLVGELSSEQELALRKLLEKLKKQAKSTVYRKCKELCEEHFEAICTAMSEKAKKGEYATYKAYKEDLLATFSSIPAEIKESMGYDSVKANVVLGRALGIIEAITDQAANEYVGEVLLLSQRLKIAEAESLGRKTVALQEKEVYTQKLHESQEEKMQLKSSVVFLEERNKALSIEIERQESKHRDETAEYKKRLHEMEDAMRAAQSSFEKELQDEHDTWMKKDLESNKNFALQEQQIKFFEEKLEQSQSTIAGKDEEIAFQIGQVKELEGKLRELQEEGKSKDKRISQLSRGGRLLKISESEMENAVLKKELEMMKLQVEESKKSHSAIMEAINKNIAEALQRDNKLAIEYKEQAVVAERAKQRCAALESKLHRMRKYHKLLQAAEEIKCKSCGAHCASRLFGAHLKLCKESENIPVRYWRNQ